MRGRPRRAASAPRRGALGQQPRRRPAAPRGCDGGIDRLSPSSRADHAVACPPTADRAAAARTRRRRVRHRCGRCRGSRSRRGGPAADWRRRSPVPPAHAARGQVELREERRRQCQRVHRRADVVATPPGTRGPAAVRAPPPAVGWASMTCTCRPALAQMTAAVRPLGPLPTTVTSTLLILPPTTGYLPPATGYSARHWANTAH